MQFFTSSVDLLSWVRKQKSPDEAANKLLEIVKGNEKDIVDTCSAIYQKENAEEASSILFKILSKYKITQTREGKMNDKMIKEAQIIGKDAPLYANMGWKVCPKLIFSVGKRMISEYNCRNQCLDSLVLDDDPNRVYCLEALWRRHVMDKFAREFKNKEGKWVGGYVNERFQVFKDDGGNQMQLAHGERTRLPRPHQYSTERRLSEGRGEETKDIVASSDAMIKTAALEQNDGKFYQMFNDVLEMREAGLSDEDIIYHVAEHYNEPIPEVAGVYKVAMKMLGRYKSTVYAMDNSKITKTADGTVLLRTTRPVNVINTHGSWEDILEVDTALVMLPNNGVKVFEIQSGRRAGDQVMLKNPGDEKFLIQETEVLEAAEEVGLHETVKTGLEAAQPEETKTDDFPVQEIPAQGAQ